MNKMTTLALTLALSSSFAMAATPAKDMLKPYPKAQKGEVQHVIELPQKSNEDNFKVELQFGKTLKVDCNRHMMGGELATKTAEGWGYDYYVLGNVGAVASTLMGCPNQEKTDKFVTIPSANQLIRYNSKLPIVVYAPEDVEVQYRIWTAPDQYTTTKVK
ncbi:MAG: serine protease inhibitor ecotin [Neisseriaceae bacterium]|nr:serine protease inhibitor ecotin [Neisseriaceae bacterium]MBP6861024.1 serine protease inhibitor ecotin [Neisseriaceae bacterium]